MKFRPHPDVLALSQYLETQATRYSEAVYHLHHAEEDIDGLPTRTLADGMPHGATEDTSVERAALARYEVRSRREQVRDDLTALVDIARSFGRVIDTTIQMFAPRPEAPRCDGREFSGAALAYVPHSRDPGNGWRDPSCKAFADASGLCPACRARERRWRAENGLPPRAASVAAGVGEVA